MGKHATQSSSLQIVDSPKSVSVQVPLPVLGALANAENAFFELCVDVGEQVFEAMMEQDREALCGPKGKHDPNRTASRAGSTSSEITMGGRRLGLRRLRVRSAEGEQALPSFVFASGRDPLDRHTMESIASGVSTRKYRRTLEKLPADSKERSVSKSSVSRRFVALSQKQMTAWLSRPLQDADIRTVMIDGTVFRDHTLIVVLGIDSSGKKQVLGLREGTTENSGVTRALLQDLLARGLDPDPVRLFVIDGSKALRSAIVKVFGRQAVIQRCQLHKRRNILAHLPESMHPTVERVLKEAWESRDAKLAKRRLDALAARLENEHPGAAGSVREGLEDTLTLQRLGISGRLYEVLRTTNPIENVNGSIASYTRNVKRWRGGSMLIRWVSAAIQDAEQRFRRIRGYRDMDRLIQALDAIQQSKTEADVRRKVA